MVKHNLKIQKINNLFVFFFVYFTLFLYYIRNTDFNLLYVDTVMRESKVEFGQSLHKLQQEPVFRLPSFEKEIDCIKARIAEVITVLYSQSSGEQ